MTTEAPVGLIWFDMRNAPNIGGGWLYVRSQVEGPGTSIHGSIFL